MLPPTVAAANASLPAGTPLPGVLTPSPAAGGPRLALPPALTTVFNPWDLLKALQRRWLLASVLGLFAAGVAVAGAYWFFQQPEFRVTTAQVWVMYTQPYKVYQPAAEAEGVYDMRLAVEAELAKSDAVLAKALADPKLEELIDFANLPENERILWVKNRLIVSGNREEATVNISLRSEGNERWMVPIANALQRAFVQASNDDERVKREELINLKKQMYQDAGGNLDKEYAELLDRRNRAPANNLASLQLQYDALNDVFQDRVKEAAKFRKDLTKILVEKGVERELAGSTEVSDEEIQTELAADEKIQRLEIEIPKKKRSLANAPNLFSDGENNPAVLALAEEVKQLEETYNNYRNQRMKEIRDTLKEQREAELELSLISFNREILKLRKFLSSEEGQVEELDKQLKKIQAEMSLEGLKVVDTSEIEELIKSREPHLSNARGELAMASEEKDAPFRVSQKAEAGQPSAEARPSQMKKIAMAGGGALVLVLAGIALLEYRTRRIHTVHEVVSGLGIRLLGAIPTWSPSSQQKAGYGNTLAYNLWTESVDTARTMVTHAAQAESARVVMITSATSGEGKTSLASHLASSLARAGHRTLLVDGDLRSPAVNALFDVPLGPGLCEVLRGQVTLEQALRSTPARGLALLTAGQWDNDALQALAQGAAQEIFAQLKEQYDYVIIDTSPVLAVADALMIGRHVDGVLLSILRDVSRVPTVYAAYQRLSMLGIRTLGAVVNGARNERYGSWYNAPPTAA